MISEQKLKWLEAAYLYYLHPEHGELISDAEWDYIGNEICKEENREWEKSLFYMKETDYPQEIRDKYK